MDILYTPCIMKAMIYIITSARLILDRLFYGIGDLDFKIIGNY